jgi:hypothetical protein
MTPTKPSPFPPLVGVIEYPWQPITERCEIGDGEIQDALLHVAAAVTGRAAVGWRIGSRPCLQRRTPRTCIGFVAHHRRSSRLGVDAGSFGPSVAKALG